VVGIGGYICAHPPIGASSRDNSTKLASAHRAPQVLPGQVSIPKRGMNAEYGIFIKVLLVEDIFPLSLKSKTITE
jgi:hypothetical protein